MFSSKRLSVFALATLLLFGCNRSGFRQGHRPGEVENLGNATVHHLADGLLIAERRDGRMVYYAIESTIAGYRLTPQGLDIRMEGKHAGTYSTTPAPPGYVAAWITEVPGEGPGATRFQVDEARMENSLRNPNPAMTIQDLRRPKD